MLFVIKHKMAVKISLLVFLCGVILVSSQTPRYASLNKGYPQLANRFKSEESNGLGNRFGEGPSGPTERLPSDALGDRELVERISKWPSDQQPFWYLNRMQIAVSRQGQPLASSFYGT